MTRHAKARLKDRAGLRKGVAEKNAERALTYGLTHAETKAGLKRYLDYLYLSHGNGNNMRVFHRHVYIFNGTTLITVLPLPKKYNELADKLERRKSEGIND